MANPLEEGTEGEADLLPIAHCECHKVVIQLRQVRLKLIILKEKDALKDLDDDACFGMCVIGGGVEGRLDKLVQKVHNQSNEFAFADGLAFGVGLFCIEAEQDTETATHGSDFNLDDSAHYTCRAKSSTEAHIIVGSIGKCMGSKHGVEKRLNIMGGETVIVLKENFGDGLNQEEVDRTPAIHQRKRTKRG